MSELVANANFFLYRTYITAMNAGFKDLQESIEHDPWNLFKVRIKQVPEDMQEGFIHRDDRREEVLYCPPKEFDMLIEKHRIIKHDANDEMFYSLVMATWYLKFQEENVVRWKHYEHQLLLLMAQPGKAYDEEEKQKLKVFYTAAEAISKNTPQLRDTYFVIPSTRHVESASSAVPSSSAVP